MSEGLLVMGIVTIGFPLMVAAIVALAEKERSGGQHHVS